MTLVVCEVGSLFFFIFEQIKSPNHRFTFKSLAKRVQQHGLVAKSGEKEADGCRLVRRGTRSSTACNRADFKAKQACSRVWFEWIPSPCVSCFCIFTIFNNCRRSPIFQENAGPCSQQEFREEPGQRNCVL